MAQEMAMLHDIARCSACRACMVACKQWHDLPADMSTPFEGQYQSHVTLTPTTWNLIRMTERTDAKGKFHWDFVKVQCMHCDDPACAKGCPEEAIDKFLAAKLRGKTPDRATLQRLSAALQRRGFQWQDIRPALARLDRDMEE